MKINCFTNLDINCYEKWPTELPFRPMVGDIITSSTGLQLEVVRITIYGGATILEPVTVDVELHLPKGRFENITKFEEWYKNQINP